MHTAGVWGCFTPHPGSEGHPVFRMHTAGVWGCFAPHPGSEGHHVPQMTLLGFGGALGTLLRPGRVIPGCARRCCCGHTVKAVVSCLAVRPGSQALHLPPESGARLALWRCLSAMPEAESPRCVLHTQRRLCASFLWLRGTVLVNHQSPEIGSPIIAITRGNLQGKFKLSFPL